VKTAQFVLSPHSVATSLLEIALSSWMSASSFAGSPRCAFTLTRNVATPADVLFQSSLIASRKMSASSAFTNVAFPPSPTHLFITLSQGCRVVPRRKPLVRDVSSWIRAFLFASHLPLLPFLVFRRFTLFAPIFPPFWLESPPAVIVPRKPKPPNLLISVPIQNSRSTPVSRT